MANVISARIVIGFSTIRRGLSSVARFQKFFSNRLRLIDFFATLFIRFFFFLRNSAMNRKTELIFVQINNFYSSENQVENILNIFHITESLFPPFLYIFLFFTFRKIVKISKLFSKTHAQGYQHAFLRSEDFQFRGFYIKSSDNTHAS